MSAAAEKGCPAPAGQRPTSASSHRVDAPGPAQDGPSTTSTAIGPARAAQRGKERQAQAGQEGGSLRWDRLSGDERRSWSARIAAREARAQGLGALASPAQHRVVAAVLVKASTTAPADVAAGEPS